MSAAARTIEQARKVSLPKSRKAAVARRRRSPSARWASSRRWPSTRPPHPTPRGRRGRRLLRARFEKMIRAAQDEIVSAIEGSTAKFQEDAFPPRRRRRHPRPPGWQRLRARASTCQSCTARCPRGLPRRHRRGWRRQGDDPFLRRGHLLRHAPQEPHGAHGALQLPLLRDGRPGSRGAPRAWWFAAAPTSPRLHFNDDAAHFHGTLKDVCDKHDETFTPASRSGPTTTSSSSTA